MQPIADPAQRINTVSSGQAQMAITGSELSYLDRATSAGLSITKSTASGGVELMFNTARAPFDDVRARRAVPLALNLDDMVKVVDPGTEAKVPKTWFSESSPFNNASLTIPSNNASEAQRLLDELAAAGKPLRFSYTAAQSGLFRRTGEYLQGQLAKFRNAQVQVEVVDNATIDRRIFQGKDFDMRHPAAYERVAVVAKPPWGRPARFRRRTWSPRRSGR